MANHDMFAAIDVAISGMRAHNQSIRSIYSNVTNANTVDAGNGQPYRRITAVLKKRVDDEIGGVEVEKIEADSSPFRDVYDPNHPYANSQGYVQMPNVDIPKEMIDLSVATRAYQANVAVLRRYQTIADNALELLK